MNYNLHTICDKYNVSSETVRTAIRNHPELKRLCYKTRETVVINNRKISLKNITIPEYNIDEFNKIFGSIRARIKHRREADKIRAKKADETPSHKSLIWTEQAKECYAINSDWLQEWSGYSSFRQTHNPPCIS